MMKKSKETQRVLLASAVLAVLIASPAAAQTRYSTPFRNGALSAYGQMAPGHFVGRDPDAVIVNGENIGQDPDPNVRLEMRKDPPGNN
jgi:hypothetical protein